MPKEMVYSNSKPYGEISSAQTVIGVRWQRDHCYAAVFCQLFNDDLKYATADGFEHVAEGDDALHRKVWAEGFYVDLDRAGINRLIRNLRRARDQAFGRDE